MKWDMPESGAKKKCLRFSFLPTIIGNKRIWLEFYLIGKYWSGYDSRWKTSGDRYLYEK